MRLDKFLKVSRIIKRRTVAKEVADKGRIEVNGRVAKSSTDLQISDVVTIHFAEKDANFEVLSLKETTKKAEAELMYREI